MSYKYSKGAQVIGDLKAEDDAERNTIIDFEEDQIDFQTSGSVRMRIQNDVITISNSLHLSGSDIEGLRIGKGGADYKQIVFETDGVDSANIQLSNAENLVIQNETNGKDIQFWVNPTAQSMTQVMTIKQDLKVGINEINPTETLQVGGNAYVNGTLKIGAFTLPSTDGTSGQILKTNGNGSVTWQNESGGGGGGGSPAGSNTQIQYNNNGSFGASSNLTFDGTTLSLDGEIVQNNYKQTYYPSNQTNTGSYALEKSFVKEFMYAKYNWSDSTTVDLFTIEPHDERTGSPYAGSNIWGAVGIEITCVGHYKGAPQGNLFSKVVGIIHWSGGSRSGLSTTNISAGANASSWFSVGNSGTLGQTLKFQYNVGSWNDGPGMIHIKVYTGYCADNPAVNDDGKYIYWVLTENFNQPSE